MCYCMEIRRISHGWNSNCMIIQGYSFEKKKISCPSKYLAIPSLHLNVSVCTVCLSSCLFYDCSSPLAYVTCPAVLLTQTTIEIVQSLFPFLLSVSGQRRQKKKTYVREKLSLARGYFLLVTQTNIYVSESVRAQVCLK